MSLLIVLLVYMIMAIQFQSLKYPLVVLGTVPLAFTGGLFATLVGIVCSCLLVKQ